MEFKYAQQTGKFFIVTDGCSTLFMAQCYSGHGDQRNCPPCQYHIGGPIPRGKYSITLRATSTRGLAKPVFELHPNGHDACGRSGFLIHGNNPANDASSGCIVMEHKERQRLQAYVERIRGGAWLEVV